MLSRSTPENTVAAGTALAARRQEFMDALLGPVRLCVGRRDTSHPLFDGCFDWHSCVHGHWALTAAARIGGHDDLEVFMGGALTDQGIARERADLAARPGFEMPYGRAWFLRLAIEFERAFRDRRLRAMADDMADSLADYLTAVPVDPMSAAYDNQSWALINLRAYGRHAHRPELVDLVDRTVETHFVAHDGPFPAETETDPHNFMGLATNWAWLVSETMDPAAFSAWLEGFLPDPTALRPVTAPTSAHLHGLNFSRAWGLWRLWRRTGDPRWLELYRDHFEPAFEQPDWWRGDYATVGHWVAQFGMFAIMPLFEPDYF